MNNNKINIIYTDQKEPEQMVYENDLGQIWMNNRRNNNMINIAMNSYSALSMNCNDSILIIEPICVSTKNYNINFLKQFKYIFTWATKAFNGTPLASKVIYTNLPSYRGKPKICTDSWLPWIKRRDEIIFIANNKSSNHPSELYSLRIKLADWLHKNSKFKIFWYGNMPIHRPYYVSNLSNKMNALKNVKFHVCMENAYDPVYTYNYLSEKMPDSWLAGAVPIYLGCSNLNELNINKKCYIDLLSMRSDFAKVEESMRKFSEQDYYNMNQCCTQLSNELYKLTSYDNVYDIILKTYYGQNN